MTALKIIICIILGICGLFLIDYNINNDTKYNIFIGALGYTMFIVGAGLFGSCL